MKYSFARPGQNHLVSGPAVYTQTSSKPEAPPNPCALAVAQGSRSLRTHRAALRNQFGDKRLLFF